MAHERYPENFDQRFNSAYGMLASVAARHSTHYMRRIIIELGLDFESGFIFGTLSQVSLAGELGPGVRLDKVLDDVGRINFELFKPVRLADLAQITGLPRETVRRKLEHLRKLGKVERTHERGWKLSDTDDEVHKAFIRETVVRILAVARELNSLLGYPP